MNQFSSKPKGNPALMEDTYVLTPNYIAVFDGATPKTVFRFPDGRTPGQIVAQTLAGVVKKLPDDCTARRAADIMSDAVADALQGHSGEASGVIFNRLHKEIWSIGDCQFALLYDDGSIERHHTEKLIDRQLSDWRSSIVSSYLSRGLMTPDEIMADDPGRRIIQPFITRQTIYQNRTDELGFGVFDGRHIPDEFIEIYPVGSRVAAVILASDGYPTLHRTLEETEAALQRMLQSDPLCIGALRGTKGLKQGHSAHDDRTFVRVDITDTML